MSFLQIVILISCLMLTQSVWARIKLVTLPDREATVVRLDNPAATLVEEERVLTLQQGNNPVDFSWQSVNIQTHSIRLQILQQTEPVELLSVSYPPSGQALVWDIASPIGQQVTARISYLLGNIDRLVTYKALVNQEESQLDLTSYLVLRNFSGENLPSSQFQLDYGAAFESEILSGATKRMEFFMAPALPITKRFTFDAGQLPWEPDKQETNVGIPVHYELHNTADNGLGQHALWNGKARLYSAEPEGEDGFSGTLFLGEDNAAFTAVGQKLKLQTGNSRDVVVTQYKLAEQRFNEVYNHNGRLIMYDTEVVMQVNVENFKTQPARVTLKEPMPKEWEMKTHSHAYTREHNQLIEFDLNVPAQDKMQVDYTYYQRHVRL